MNKTKIVCTIGPSTNSPEIIKELINSGMNVARLNFSHGSHESHKKTFDLIRQISDELDKPIAIIQDLSGPKIRTGKVEEKGIELIPGNELILTIDDMIGKENKVSVSYKNILTEVKINELILLADGLMEIRVKEIKGNEIKCIVESGGILTSNKGINLPGTSLNIPALTVKDKKDLEFGLLIGVDFVALSFVKNGADIDDIKQIINSKGKNTPVIAKIEKHEAIENFDEILDKSDAIMVARGDLGVEVPLEKVPLYQKMLVTKAVQAGKPVIIATQMLSSMVNSPRPTRAEATDIANAVLDGTDALMLSEETASGNHPVEAVKYMRKIADNAEQNYPYSKFQLQPQSETSRAVPYAACILSNFTKAAAIVAPTRSGNTAAQISRFRPESKIIALSPLKESMRKLCLYWGCIPKPFGNPKDTDQMLEQGAKAAIDSGIVKKGDTIVITAGHPIWVSGTTNMLKVKNL
ncbi:MAG: pyruvate kinase [Desulforegulaceae bacterium]|nr:pyruvate kinase [Desulforegulaceae bacterium]